ncbi:abortive infection system antitoxin AbiGi family protein [Paraburkholderia aspalathi]|uniref:Putative abortive phage resistance protein AbiGi, antitoxin n=1 Tax=Paraburkholderia aspalathi TaxID=1324617 RepID=A0A1I7ERY9_9BURK|nr:abortive infection system antitoxin AbiGi family protein [Paraburkholderia aspalathi]SFU26698.1 Putative abortive phage resistance protein AbiGi, antitoxin [Paraburkholderia aspalathi]
MQPKSNTLFHFTKSQETLKLILLNGFWPRYCLEHISWLGLDDHDYIAFPMTCFCDIPLSRISEHVGFYGQFGIGVTRQWAEMNNLNPVIYVAGENGITASFRDLMLQGEQHSSEDLQKEAKISLRYIFAHAKPTVGNMVIDGEPIEKHFYQESEWRHVPKSSNINEYLIKSNFEDKNKLFKANNKTKENCMLEFGPRDIRYIFVKSDSDIPEIINFIQKDLDRHPLNDLKILMSRVVSLESMSDDL